MRGPKKVDVHLPGPEPSPNNSPAKDMLKKKRSSLHKRDPAYKPGAAESDEDASSVAESSAGAPGTPRVRRTEPERIQHFRDDPHCDQFEEHRVHCTNCDKWISLGKRPTYAITPWANHLKRCIKNEQPTQDEEEEDEIEEETGSAAARSAAGDRKRTTEVERRAILETDPMVEEARPHEVLCKVCHRWIKLASSRVYVLGNWNRHKESCTGKTQPSDRVAMAERKLKVVNDTQAKSFTPRAVECASCGETIRVGKGLPDYDLTKWNEHKTQCVQSEVKSVIAPLVNGAAVDPIVPAVSDVVDAATEYIASPDKGTKRPRQSEDGDVETDSRPQTRQRTADYEPPQQDPPGPWGWFLMPFKNFFRGFREGLSGGSTS
ncbi:hypothetical protein NEOLEDRAFT_1164557 [Neolentinus lepideus HHB14362 ss-1]|uniref:Uncharacterized protein n=1 Tax=Neolentinus lepideus HHB14362 ss-1 TaxID=1314782 RepID=A0A165PWJ1_9AGAM|nr:hypothetical protein NEOLEDRAFT_1164557 [Neolentinus lepideus HHB14362 ss-1]